MEKIDNFMLDAIKEKIFPCAAIFVSKEYKKVFKKTYGISNIFTKEKLSEDYLFDLASLTKPLATTLVIAKLIEDNKLNINEEIANILPIFKNNKKITIKEILQHRSGLPAHKNYHKDLALIPFDKRDKELIKKIASEKIDKKKTLYSDIGFIALRYVIEKIEKKKFKDAVLDLYKNMKLKSMHFPEISNQIKFGKYVATEKCDWRQTVLKGVVHDENSYVMGGADGHAGLFGNIDDTHTLVLELLKSFYGKSEKILKQDSIKMLFNKEGRLRPLGFDIPDKQDSSCGKYFSDNTVGHLGFTGTSFWIDIEKKIIILLLTNRVHPSRKNEKIKQFRPKFHNFIMENYLIMKK